MPEAKPKIITEHVFPPIPDRRFDWSATRDGYEPGDLIGRGKTEADAINDLEAEERFREEERCTCRVIGANGDPEQHLRRDEWCPVHGRDPDQAYEEYRDRREDEGKC